MTVEPSAETLEERLARLEDALFAEHLLLEHPALYAQAGEPPRTQREILAWTTRRFGTIALAVTAAVSIAAGYVLAPLVTERAAPQHAAHRAAPHVAAARPRLAAPPVVHHAAIVRHAAIVHHAARVPHAAIVLAPRAVPAPRRETSLLRAKLRAQERELARLRALAAEEEAAARAAQARADAAIRAQPKPQPQPRAQRAAETTATATTTVPASAPVDVPAADPNAGAKPPSNPNGGWTEHPPLPGPYGSIGPVPIGGTIDPCTPRGGRIGVVLNAILGNTDLGSHVHF